MSEEVTLWSEMLDVLKDISNYLAKQDATQEKADIDKPPRVKETQKPIVGGGDPDGKPGAGIAKAFPDVPDLSGPTSKEDIDSEGKTQLKKADDDDEEDEDEEDGKEDKEDNDDAEELKSLLKDIRSALLSKSPVNPKEISKLISTEIKKEIPGAMDKMLRKMGYTMTKPDVTRFGVDDDTAVIRKSSDKVEESTEDSQLTEANKAVSDLSKKSWAELAKIRESTGDFKIFPR